MAVSRAVMICSRFFSPNSYCGPLTPERRCGDRYYCRCGRLAEIYIYIYPKKRNKRPIKPNAPGRLKSQKHAKNGANAPGRLIYFILLKNARVRCKRPGAFYFVLFREEGSVGRAHDTRRCSKRTCCRSGKGRFAACSGWNSMGI